MKCRRWRGAAVAALAVAAMGPTAMGLAGCSSGATPAAEKTEKPKPLSNAEAAEAFRTYVATDSVARASGDERLALALTADGRARLTAAAYRSAAFSGDPVPRYAYGAPQLFVPTIAAYPRWFVAMVNRWEGGKRRTALMVFNKPEPDGRWQLTLSTLLDPGEALPHPTRDSRGFAKALPTKSPGFVSQPRMVGALQATMVEEGPNGPSAGVIAPGAYTSGLYKKITADKHQLAQRGLIYNPIFSATSTPMFVLRTRDGGALVLYCYTLEATTTPRRRGNGAPRVAIPVPETAAPLLNKPVAKRKLETIVTYQYAAFLPLPRGTDPDHPLDPIRVIGSDGGLTSAKADTDDKD